MILSEIGDMVPERSVPVVTRESVDFYVIV